MGLLVNVPISISIKTTRDTRVSREPKSLPRRRHRDENKRKSGKDSSKKKRRRERDKSRKHGEAARPLDAVDAEPDNDGAEKDVNVL
jgi:hypothetical protein